MKQKGFTLLEMIVVVMIIAVLFLLTIPNISGVIGVVDDKNYDFIADNLKLLGKKDGLYYYMYQATDVEFNTEDEEVAKAYTSIAKTIPKIRKSFEFR